MTTADLTADELAIRRVIDGWIVWSDSGDWERFATVWHTDGWMTATWFQGPAHEFIAARRAGFERGVSIIHFQGGTSCELRGARAIAQTKMTINQRAAVDGVEVDVVCTGRWAIVRRQPIYEKDRLDPVDPSARLSLDPALLATFPQGYRHLGYLQTKAGFKVRLGLPGLRGPEVATLYAEGEEWLGGAATAGKPL